MTRYVISRHGHVEGIDPPHFRGRTELPLSDRGRREIAALASRIAAELPPVAIYCSPLGRCVETARAVSEATGIAPQATGDLLDLDYGDWQGRSHAEMGELNPEALTLWYTTPQRMRFPMGESLQDLAVRAADMARHIAASHGDDTVLLVGHDSIDRVLLLHLLDMPLSSYWRFECSPCSITVTSAPMRR